MDQVSQQALLLNLLTVMREHGSWCGETHVQKCAYFLQEGFGVPLGFDFVLYRHGPFSFDLRRRLGEMRGDLLIDVVPHPPYGPSLQVTESGRRLTSRVDQIFHDFGGSIERVAAALGPRSVGELEQLGTALYVLREDPARPVAVRVARLRLLKPHISEALAEQAVVEADHLLEDQPSVTTVG